MAFADDRSTTGWHPSNNLRAVAVSESMWWLQALQLTASRLSRQNEPGTVGLSRQIDARFFVIALERFRTSIENLAIPQLALEAQLQAQMALTEFHKVARRRDIIQARNTLMHSDAYLSGRGNAQTTVHAKQPAISIGELSSRYATGIGYYLDGTVRVGSVPPAGTGVFRVRATTDAAGKLFDAVYALLRMETVNPQE